MGRKLNFAHIWSCDDVFDPQILPKSTVSAWYIWMELEIQNCNFAHIWDSISEMHNTAPIKLLIDKISYLVHQNGVMGP